jgi:tRNA (mo5U34)-methyltransferase
VTVTHAELSAEVAANPVWYHTLDLGAGVVTPGWFDLRPIAARLPWPDLKDKRCLDVGTYDGFFAFEMERRGAGEVLAMDIGDHRHWDWPPDVRGVGGEQLARWAGEKGAGFEIAAKALGSQVRKLEASVYDLASRDVGTFDFIFCGSLLLHLRDPMRALEAMRSVCRGQFLSAEQVDLWLTFVARGFSVARLNGMGPLCQWWVPSVQGHRRMVRAAGFAIEAETGPYVVPFGVSHPAPSRDVRTAALRLGRRITAGGWGVPHAAVLARRVV